MEAEDRREARVALLRRMAEAYPDEIYPEREDKQELGDLLYLAQHGLFDVEMDNTIGAHRTWDTAVITAAGLDFLDETGGIGAELNSVTVRLHQDTIRELLLAQVDALDIPAPQKATFRKHLGDISKKALADGLKDLLLAGLRQTPQALDTLRKLLGPAP